MVVHQAAAFPGIFYWKIRMKSIGNGICIKKMRVNGVLLEREDKEFFENNLYHEINPLTICDIFLDRMRIDGKRISYYEIYYKNPENPKDKTRCSFSISSKKVVDEYFRMIPDEKQEG